MLRATRIGIAIVTVGSAFASTGCSSMNNTEKGAVVGGGVGAVVGTAIGAATGNPRTGAAVGALGGTALGALAGNKEDKKEAAIERAELQQAAATQNTQLGLMDVVTMSRQGTDADVIVAQIRNTNSVFTLSTADIQYCTEQGVSPKVIRAMQDSRVHVVSPRPQRVIVRELPPPPPAVIIERPVYGYGYGYGYGRRW
ncbi:glycine zipper domain-containing protein [Limnoglobus roseus]|uniref:Glycine zipper domain-containing protein n=1 Tax=Limnoglobus roseus TaxID=2598579 RepID=A0A5C1ADF9_9BACT|nr:glycine zipper domain-containing protein [Limnoglobus roseus]QEL16036.1 hypothetical protein PX52LOC_02974 [Limnoglobus roseus]